MALAGFLAACSFGGDSDGDGGSSDTSYSITTTQATRQLNLTASDFSTNAGGGIMTYEIPADVSSVTVSGVNTNKNIYLTKTNPTGITLPANLTQSVATASGVTLGNAEQYSTKNNGVNWTDILIGLIGILFGGNVHHFVPPANFSSTVQIPGARMARLAGNPPDRSNSQLPLNVGITKKNLYVDNDANISTFVQKPTTLRAVGTYCNVWVVDDYYSSSSSSNSLNKVDSNICTEFAKKFDSFYKTITGIFGDESDLIYYYYNGNSFSTAAMEKLSETGTFQDNGKKRNKINIVIYDIGNDSTSSSGGGVVGYFYAKDYYPNGTDIRNITGSSYGSGDERILNYSNEGKYFYIDSYYANTETTMTYSTLAHEFQHMINWNQKTMLQNLEPSAAFNEMLSMLCEDIMQSTLNLDNDDSPIARLPMFSRCYMDCGLEYREDSSYYTILSYADNYAFGAWLVRNYGGRSLVSKLSRNAAVDTASIEMASGTSMQELLKLFTFACIDKNVSKSFNNNSEAFTAIDLWNLKNELSKTYNQLASRTNYYKFDGPQLLGYDAKYALRPYGINLLKVGTSNSNSFTLNFGTTTVASDEHVYLVID